MDALGLSAVVMQARMRQRFLLMTFPAWTTLFFSPCVTQAEEYPSSSGKAAQVPAASDRASAVPRSLDGGVKMSILSYTVLFTTRRITSLAGG